MSYFLTPEALHEKLQEEGLAEMAGALRDGSDGFEVGAETTTGLVRTRLLLYAFLKMAGIKSYYRIKVTSPTTLEVVPVSRERKRVRRRAGTFHEMPVVNPGDLTDDALGIDAGGLIGEEAPSEFFQRQKEQGEGAGE